MYSPLGKAENPIIIELSVRLQLWLVSEGAKHDVGEHVLKQGLPNTLLIKQEFEEWIGIKSGAGGAAAEWSWHCQLQV